MPFVSRKRTLIPRLTALAAASAWLVGASVVFDGPRPAGEYVAYPVTVSLDASESAAGVQFDIDLDLNAVQFVDVQPGPAAENAGKDVVFSMLDDDTVRVLVLGLNQEQLASGVVANVYVTPRDAAGGGLPLTLSEPVFSDPYGNSVAPAFTPEGDDADSDTDGDNSYTPPDSGESTSADQSGRSAGPDSKSGLTAPASSALMPALLDSFLGDYAPPGSGPQTGGAQGTPSQPRSAGTTAAGAQPQHRADAAYGAPAYLPPQAYDSRPPGRAAPGARPQIRRPNFTPKPAVPEERGDVARPETERHAAAFSKPLRVSWPAPAVMAPASCKPVKPGLRADNNVDLSRYANRRAVLPALACAAALVLVLRNACVPLARLLREVVRF